MVNVYASSSSNESVSDNSDLSCSSVSNENTYFKDDCLDYISCAPNTKCDNQKATSTPKNFISKVGCPGYTPCTPYLEFSRIVEFFTIIPNYRRLNSLLEKNDLKALEKIASRSSSTQNYDSNSAFYYYADSCMELSKNVFSYDFVTYFLSRFYYFLHLGIDKKTALVNGDNFENLKSKRTVNLLDIPSSFISDFESESQALKLFKMILSDHTITKVVSDFVSCLKTQINASYKKCNIKTKSNSYYLYFNLLQSYLSKSIQISGLNLKKQIDFIKPQKQFPFVLFPYQLSSSSDKDTLLIAFDPKDVLTTENTARFIQ
jgi:hypothetical protein